MTAILVCPWAEVDVHVEERGVSHIVSLLGMEGVPATPLGFDAARHLHIEVDDIAGTIVGFIAPQAVHVAELIAFARGWDRKAPLLVHCYAGISRSTAAALAVMCLYNPGREFEAARLLRQRAPHALPNRRIVALADEMLELDGRLVDAVDSLGPREQPTIIGRLVELPILLGR